MKFSNFYKRFVDKFDTPKNSKLIGQNFQFEILVQKAISPSILDGFQQIYGDPL